MKKKKVTGKGYRGYVEAFNKKYSSLLKRNLLPVETKPLSKVVWEATYSATRNELLKEVRLGNRKTIGNVNQYIIGNQVYGMSLKQAKSLQYAAREILGEKYTLAQIRSGLFDEAGIKQRLKEDYQRGRALGFSSEEVSLLISQYYFGSE